MQQDYYIFGLGQVVLRIYVALTIFQSYYDLEM